MRAVAPWVRTRLRAAPGPAVALALLALITAFLAAAFPRAVDTYEGAALRHELGVASPDHTVVEVTRPLDSAGLTGTPGQIEQELRPGFLGPRYDRVVATLPDPLRADPGQSSYGVHTLEGLKAADPWLPRPEGLASVFTLSTQSDLAGHSRLREGRLPRAAAGSVTATTTQVEAAVTTENAGPLGIKVGSTIHLPSTVGRQTLAVRITGIVEPLRPSLSYWSAESSLRRAVLTAAPGNGGLVRHYWAGGLLLPPEAGPALLGATDKAESYWRVAPETAGLRGADIGRIDDAVASLEHGPLQTELRTSVAQDAEADSGLDDIVTGLSSLLGAVRPVVAVAAFGAGTVAGVVLLMAAGLAAGRRGAELTLLRARGASVRGIAGRLLAETAVPVLPATAAGWGLAVLLTPEGRLPASVLAAVGVAVLGCGALPVRAAILHRRPRLHGERDDLVRARPSRRRTVAELTLLVVTVGAVVALRRRGTSEGGVDQLVSAAPVLVGVIAALVLGRLYPLPLRFAARPMARRRGATGFLSLARAGRSATTAALPLLALLIALTTAAFGGSVLAGISDARDRASLLSVGADASVEAVGQLPASLVGAVRKTDGVRDVTSLERDDNLDLGDVQGGAVSGVVTLLAVDPDSYARLARTTGRGAFPADELKRPGASGPLRGIASPGVAARLGGGSAQVGNSFRMFSVRVAAVRNATPAMSDGDFLVVNAADLPEHQDNTLLVTGPSVRGSALRATARAAGAGLDVRLRSETRDALTDSPAQSGAERIYTVAVAAGAGFAVLALLLALLQAAPERTALLARLRTMGLTRPQGRRLLVMESMPQALLAACGGALVGWAAIRLLAPGLDLARLALSDQQFAGLTAVHLRADPLSLLLPAVGVVVLAAGVAVVQAWLATRRTTTTELRAGDPR